MLENDHHRVPVTALAFFNHTLLSGEGHTLRAYHTTHGSVLGSYPVFEEENQQIHGLIASEIRGPLLLAWGGSLIKSLALGHNEDHTLRISPRRYIRSPDWILHAAVSPSCQSDGEDRLVAFATAHNGLVVLRASEFVYSTDISSVPDPVDLLVPGSNCILYSAQVSWLSPTHCLVAAGTAFGDVILWSCHISSSAETGRLHASTTVHYTFSAHEGSVFGVQVSPSSILGEESRPRMLATCSDDRTVRVWDVSDLSTSCPTLVERERDTGFGSDALDDTNFAPPCLAKAMGHISRIWHVRFLDTPSGLSGAGLNQVHSTETLIASFGEDTAYNVWSLHPKSTPGDGLPYDLQQISSKTAHTGKHIWSVATSRTGLIATGGADGGIAIYDAPLHGAVNQPLEISRELLPREKTGELQGKASRDNYRAYTFLDTHTLLCTTDFGRILVTSLPQADKLSPELRVREISAPLTALQNYSVVASSSGLGFISGTSGEVYLYPWLNDSALWLIAQTGHKAAGLFACAVQNNTINDKVYLLVTNVGAGNATVLQMSAEIPSNLSEKDAVEERWNVEMPAPGFVATSFTVANLSGRHWGIIGSRAGGIAVCPLEDGNPTTAAALKAANAHGNEAVTALNTVTNSANVADRQSGTETVLHSVGRDGAHAIHYLCTSPDRMEASSSGDEHLALSLIHNLPLPFGPNLENVYRTSDGQLWIWGFRGKSFIAYNTSTQQEVMNVECGGAHRNWAFQPLSSEDFVSGSGGMQGGTFVWTKASKLFYQTTAPGQGYRRINSGGHGREIKTVAVLEELQLIATGAEDTNIKLFTYNNSDESDVVSGQSCQNGDNPTNDNKLSHSREQAKSLPLAKRFQCLQTLRKHNTGIQHLQFLVCPPTAVDVEERQAKPTTILLSSGGCEEFHIWKLHPHKTPSTRRASSRLDIGVVCASTHPQSGKSDLRIMGFEAGMSHEADNTGSATVVVQMAYSDSTLRTWSFDLPSAAWKLDREGDYLSACLTGVFSFPSPLLSNPNQTGPPNNPPRAQTQPLITTSTDGHLALWPIDKQQEDTKTLRWTRRIKVHQNAILASATRVFAHGAVLVATGGDDNAIGLTVFGPFESAAQTQTQTQEQEPKHKTFLIPRAHAAAVTGLAIYACGDQAQETAMLVSVGLDQRVKVWEVRVEGVDGMEAGSLRVKRRCDVGTCVADGAGVVLLNLGGGGGGSRRRLEAAAPNGDADEGAEVQEGLLVVGVGMEVWKLSV